MTAEHEVESRKAGIGAKIAARDAERLERKKERGGDVVAEEDVHGFHTRFTEKMKGLQESLTQIEAASKDCEDPSTLEPRFAEVKDQFQAVKEFVNAGCLHLPPYDQRSMQMKLSAFEEEQRKTHSQVIPRKKFGFKKKREKKAATAGGNTGKAEAGSRHSDAVGTSSDSRNALDKLDGEVEKVEGASFIGRKGETIVLDQSVLKNDDVYLKQCEGCTIFLCGVMGALRMKEIKDCVVMTGPITGGCLIEGAVNTKLYLVAHQMRLHNMVDCDLYLQMRSHPIIEDCTGLRFAPYTLEYPGLEEQLAGVDLAAEACGDKWSQVQDFKWLKQHQSPNWCIMDEPDRVAPTPPPMPEGLPEGHS